MSSFQVSPNNEDINYVFVYVYLYLSSCLFLIDLFVNDLLFPL